MMSSSFSSSGPGWPPPRVADAGAAGNPDAVDLPAEDADDEQQPSAEETP